MANDVFWVAREQFALGDLSWRDAIIKVALYGAGYTPDIANDIFLSSLGANIIATSAALTNKTAYAGQVDASDIVLYAVTGAEVTGFVVFADTGNPSTSRLIANFDSATGLPFTPSGGNVTIQWDNSSYKIFLL
jgi:hypothetical protein